MRAEKATTVAVKSGARRTSVKPPPVAKATGAKSVEAAPVRVTAEKKSSKPKAPVGKLSADLRRLEKKLEHKFVQPNLLQLAMTHRSQTPTKRATASLRSSSPRIPSSATSATLPAPTTSRWNFSAMPVLGMVGHRNAVPRVSALQ